MRDRVECSGCANLLCTFAEHHFTVCDNCFHDRCGTCGGEMWYWVGAGKANICSRCGDRVCGNCEQDTTGLLPDMSHFDGDDEDFTCTKCLLAATK